MTDVCFFFFSSLFQTTLFYVSVETKCFRFNTFHPTNLFIYYQIAHKVGFITRAVGNNNAIVGLTTSEWQGKHSREEGQDLC